MSINVELGQHEAFRNGYPSLASWISRDNDSEGFIFRKFDYLGARNLLYTQPDLTCWEKQLLELDAEVWNKMTESFSSRHACGRFSSSCRVRKRRRVQAVGVGPQDPAKAGGLSYVMLTSVCQHVLRRPDKALLLQRRVIQLDKPRARVLRAFKKWSYGVNEDDHLFGGVERTLLDYDDVCALRVPNDEDLLSRFVQNHWLGPRKVGNQDR